MNKKIKISPFSAIVSFLAVALLGYILLPLLPVKIMPDESLPSVTVSYNMPGASPRAVEEEVTSKLEGVLSRVSGVRHIDSRSSAGGGRITIELDRLSDLDKARFETAMYVRQTAGQLPDEVSYPAVSLNKIEDESARPFMVYSVNSVEKSAEIKRFCEDKVVPLLGRIKGVEKVEISGGVANEWLLEYDNELLQIEGITTQDILESISDYLGIKYLGMSVKRDSKDDRSIRIALRECADVSILHPDKIVVTRKGGRIITLDKVAKVSHVEETAQSYYRINSLNSVNVSISASKTASQILLSREIGKVMEGLSLPSSFSLSLNYDASQQIDNQLGNLYLRTGLTVFILLFFVGIATLNLRYLLLITISLAVNMGVSFVFYYLFDVEIQLYSLAGIAISFNLVIDNLIVMTEHVLRRHDLKAFPSILAATLTTLGALSIVFFLDEATMLSLLDFVVVVSINLGVSLIVSLLLVPPLISTIQLRIRNLKGTQLYSARQIAGSLYSFLVRLACRHKYVVVATFVLIFGLPVFMLPYRIDSDSCLASVYNHTIGSDFYNKKMRSWIDIALGGSLRLFVEYVYDGNYWNSNEDPVIHINAKLPNGATIEQMDALVQQMENFLMRRKGNILFKTYIYNARSASIEVYFDGSSAHTSYPYQLKSEIVGEALNIGGASWDIHGLRDNSFNNDVRQSSGSCAVKMMGYNYDKLYSLAMQFRDSLLTHHRIKEVLINCDRSVWKDDYTEYFLTFDKEKLAKDNLTIVEIVSALHDQLGRGNIVGSIFT
ncbi:MAG: efflux RND transporter permease subunit, partial [Muribaculum sp.]|nr:efflux RND transporter permease subunit [Muribaculum sp.]